MIVVGSQACEEATRTAIKRLDELVGTRSQAKDDVFSRIERSAKD